jgi:hypothetical protein
MMAVPEMAYEYEYPQPLPTPMMYGGPPVARVSLNPAPKCSPSVASGGIMFERLYFSIVLPLFLSEFQLNFNEIR